jgi:RNA ligase (TIGR02306 family)
MGVDTHKVEIVPVVLEPHPDPETTSLSVVKVYNFTVVVRTSDWLGVDKAAYVQPDSVLPDKPEYRFLKETGNLKKEREALNAFVLAGVSPEDYKERLAAIEAKIDANTKRLRITVQKLRGVLSMGMLLPAPEGSQIGDDVADLLGIGHYERPAEGERLTSKGDDVAPPPPSCIFAPSYDVESVYKYADLFEAGEMVYVTEKLDGQNARFVATSAGNETYTERTLGGHVNMCTPVTLHAGSRNEWKKQEGGSNWWRVQTQNEWIPKWCYDNQDRVLYGETFGWVADLKYGSKQGQLWFRSFDVLEGSEWWDAEKFMAEFHESLRVPCLGIMPFDFEKLKKLADGPSLIEGANHIREGIVIKPLKERRHWKLGRVFVKMVSNAYLEKSSR